MTFSTFDNTERMRIDQHGNIGIGIKTPSEKLAVNGNIRAKEIKVEAINWPDFVFEDGYKIRPLEDLELYIKVNKHLPDVPSANEVENGGVELGRLNNVLLKKIEELTLHVINIEKENLNLKMAVKFNSDLELRVQQTEKILNELKNNLSKKNE